jgi:sec-independent protein translocase protein TatC
MARQKAEETFKEMELWEHLAELRTRLMRSILYLVVGMVVAWIFFEPLYNFFVQPIIPIMKSRNIEFVYRHITEAFMVRLQISFIAGLIVALPCITGELWGFIAPGLTRTERKAFYFVAPLSIFFFVLGIACAYWVLKPAFSYFVQFLDMGPTKFALYQDPLLYITFVFKMLLAFGVCFQLPVVLMFLGYAGIVTSASLKQHWRPALVVCAVVAAVATPSNDALTMSMMAAPMCVLYLASIGLVQMVERIRERHNNYRPSYDTA